MAITIVSDDTIQGSSLSISPTDLSITRRILIQGVEPTNAGQQYEVIINAEKGGTGANAIPQIGDLYPENGTGPVKPYFRLACVSKEVNPVADSKGIWEIVCTYEKQDAANIKAQDQYYPSGNPFSDWFDTLTPEQQAAFVFPIRNTTSSLTSLQTNKLYGPQLTGQAKPDPSDTPTWGTSTPAIELFRQNQTPSSKNKTLQNALVDVQKPSFVLQYRKHEYARPESLGAHEYLGYMNNDTFGIYGPKTVLFTGLNYEPVGYDEAASRWSYLSTYTFQVATFGTDWTTDVVYTGDDNLPIGDANDDFADDRTARNYLTYPQTKFEDFGLEP